MPFPYLFWRYGARIRMRCKYAAQAAAVLVKMRAMNEEDGRPAFGPESDGEGMEMGAVSDAESSRKDGHGGWI
jgi:hypothetical protein